MSKTMKVQLFDKLLRWILKEYEEFGSIFGIHQSLFFRPQADNPYATQIFGHYLATPIGPAAGPHTQLTQNIVCAWLSGGRFMELKTVQIMDELEIPRPCIDMEDEGYNVEWSQELKLRESAGEYIKAWALIPILRRLLDMEDAPFGTIFNLSVGYNLEGIQTPPMIAFMDQMADASQEIDAIRQVLDACFPQFADVEIPGQLSDNVTLSTMHGCPPDEIEAIARFMLEERGLHTYVKLNPTLLGKDDVLRILQDDLGFTAIDIPDSVFEHDLKYGRALELVKSLQHTAAQRNLEFGVKLSNTLAMANHKQQLPGDEMYMSGRALYPITINLFDRLAHEFDGQLKVSYSGGADALNMTEILAAGALPVTMASELLKPGGYSRLLQCLEKLEFGMQERDANSLAELAAEKLDNVASAAADSLQAPRYKKAYFPYGLPKVESGLGLWDCVVSPCIEQCAVLQDVPEYAWLIAQGDYDRALKVILARNPLPGVTGYVCTKLCETRCTRNDYEEPVAIRALKRFAFEHGDVSMPTAEPTGHQVAVIGSGPAGLSAAAFLALNGVKVTIFEAKDEAGGMLRAVPVFRLPWSVIQEDVDRITAMGVEIKLDHRITRPPEELLQDGFDAVYVAAGFQKDAQLVIDGIKGPGVFAALDLLDRSRRGELVELGSKALVIGGGDTAMDAIRVSQRFTGNPVTCVYRRTEHEMPANQEEKEGAFDENNILLELASPTRVIREHGRLVALECVRNQLGQAGPDGRRRPVVIEGSEFQIETDSIIVAVGQSPDLAFLDGSQVSLYDNGAIKVDPATGWAGAPNVYAGGDAVVGPDSIIAACGDGRIAAEAICQQFGIDFEQLPARPAQLTEDEINEVKWMRARKVLQVRPQSLPVEQRGDFSLIEFTYTEEMAQQEAQRCVQCTTFCDKCVEVCPNRANFVFLMTPVDWQVPLLSGQNGELVEVGRESFVAAQGRQILHLDDFCNECDDCATFCVHQGEPYTQKPRLFLQEHDFKLETENAFYIKGNLIKRIEEGQEAQLWIEDGVLTFENAKLRVSIASDFTELQEMVLKELFAGQFSLKFAAEMLIVYRGVTESLPYMLV